MPKEINAEREVLDALTGKYVEKFGVLPPYFGYEDDMLIVKIKQALKTGKEMQGIQEDMIEELGIPDDVDPPIF